MIKYRDLTIISVNHTSLLHTVISSMELACDAMAMNPCRFCWALPNTYKHDHWELPFQVVRGKTYDHHYRCTNYRRITKLFAQFGLPEQLVSDNGPQLIAQEFETFIKLNEINTSVAHLTNPSLMMRWNNLFQHSNVQWRQVRIVMVLTQLS